MIELSQSTTSLIEKIETLSGKKLTYKKELGLLVELAHQHKQIPVLDQLGFLGKFVHNAFRILKRIDNEDKDNQRLAKEFQENIEKTKGLMKDIISYAPSEVQRDFNQEFLDLTPAALQHLLVFCRDLSWYKNYQIDTRRM